MSAKELMITASELGQRNGRDGNDLWVAIDGDVYDLTKFAVFHPGGAPPLKLVAGQDATEQFYELHRKEVLQRRPYQRLKIGKLEGYVAPPATDIMSVPFADPGYLRKFSPYYNESHHRLRKFIREFVEHEIMPTAIKDDEMGNDPSAELNKKMAKAGFFCTFLPRDKCQQLGYSLPAGVSWEEFDYFHELILSEEIKRIGAYGLTDGLVGGNSIGLPPVLMFGSDYLIDYVVRPCLEGDARIALCISEPYAGSDVSGIRSFATLSADGSHYLVSGVKKWITGGRFAHFFTVLVNTDQGPALMVIERRLPGAEEDQVKTSEIKTSYSSAAGTAYVEFNDVVVPVANVIGQIGQGFRYTMHNFNHERWAMCVGGNRLSRLMLEEAFKWAKTRKVFGKELIKQPVIRFKIAQMAAEVESVHSMIEDITYQMCQMTTAQINATLAGPIALLKYKQTRAATVVADQICQIFGGRALTRSGMGVLVEKYQRSYKMQAILGGSEEIMADLAIRQAMKGFKGVAARL